MSIFAVMKAGYNILYLKRDLLRCLFIAVQVVMCHLTMKGGAVDSLYLIYQNTPEGSAKTEMANKFFLELRRTQFIDTLLHFGNNDKPATIEAHVHYWMSEYYFDQEKYEASIDAGNLAKGLMTATGDEHFMSDVLGCIANGQYRIGNYDDALKTMLDAYKLDKKLNDKELISSDLNTFAAIYLAVQQPEPGIRYIEKAIQIERQIKRPDRLAIRLGMASELYLINNELDKAMAAINEALQLDQQGGRKEKAAIRLVQKGAILEKMSRLEEAKETINLALPALEQADATYSLAVAFNQMGSILLQENDDPQAIACFKKALEYSIKCGSPKTELTAERGLWESMRETNPSVAMLHLERYTQLNDSMLSRTMSVQLKVMGTTNQHMEMAELNEKSEKFNKLVKWGGLTLLTLLLMTLSGLFLAWRRNKSALHMQAQTEIVRTRFFSNITNKLQTPLTVVMSAGQQLLDGGKVSADDSRKLGEMIVSHGKNMLSLVNQLIDIDRSSVSAQDLKRGDIVMYVSMLVDNFNDIAQQQMITLEFVCPAKSLMVAFPPDHIHKIVHNLISNAIKFTPRNGKVTVGLAPLESNKVRITVADTGKGIPLNEKSHIFSPFDQSLNGDDGVSTALDLTLVNQLVTAMDGTISVESESGKGTTFTIDVPLQPATSIGTNDDGVLNHQIAEKRIRQAGDGNIMQKPLVFIVENNENVAFFIASHLQRDYELRIARDGREALQNAQDLVPDLIITDIMMPVMDGKELISRLRNNASLSHIPIIALTSNMSERERLECFEAGADNVLVKPFNSSELRIVAGRLIKQRLTLRERFNKTSNDMSDHNQAKQLSKADQEFINKLVDVIHVQMANDDIDMEHVAAALSLSRKQLRTRVMAITGLTPVAYVLQVRLNYARRMIAADNTPLTKIASKCGFQNLSHFSKAFKQQFGVSPLQFRKNVDDISLNKN